MNNAEGADVSKWDGGPDDDPQVIDFDPYGEAWDFIVVKALEGVVEDRLFRPQWNAARGKSVRQPYCFWREYVDAQASAQKAVSILGNDAGELPYALDLEDELATEAALSKAHVWVDEYHRLTGLWPEIYSTFWWLIDHGSGRKTILGTFKNAWLLKCKLWLAQYPFDSIKTLEGYTEVGNALRAVLIQEVIDGQRQLTWPIAPWPWNGNQVGKWQWTSRYPPGQVPGYYTGPNGKDAVDHNFDVLSKEVFWATYPINGGAEPPPPTGGTMYEATVTLKAAPSLRVRSDHSTDSQIIGALLPGERAQGDLLYTAPNGERWLRFSFAVNGVPQVAWIAVFFGGVEYCTIVDLGGTPPPVSIHKVIELVDDGVVWKGTLTRQ